jgi:small subunit ribosomal protein S12
MESVQLEHENVTQLVLFSLWDGMEEGRSLSNKEKDPIKRIEREPIWGENLMYSSVEGQ